MYVITGIILACASGLVLFFLVTDSKHHFKCYIIKNNKKVLMGETED